MVGHACLDRIPVGVIAVGPVDSKIYRSNAARQLFDHRKDNPVRFSVLARPQPGRPSDPKIGWGLCIGIFDIFISSVYIFIAIHSLLYYRCIISFVQWTPRTMD